MSSGTVTPPLPPSDTPVVAPPPTEYETFIDQRLRQTRRQVKGVDIAGGLVTLAIGVLGYLLAAAVVDHWLIVGGLGFWGRILLWIGLVGAAGTYFAYCLLPPMLHRINPVFAASTIEKSQPSLRNSLINFLLLRGRRSEVAGPVFQAMEYRAAADLSKVRIDVAVDRTRLVRLGCVLAGLVALFCLYLVLSPKNPLRSAARVLWPWSTIEAPTRVTIRDVQPGDATVFHGESVIISAEIAGLRKGESPTVIFSTADGQIVEQNIPMTPPEEGRQYQCTLPPGNLGLQQDYEYRLAAGDCRSRRYRIAVQMAPAIDVEKVTYHYPAYTGLPDRTVERQGDLKAIEGTEVSLHAAANSEIKPETAQIDLGCTGRPGVRMSAAGRAADGRFTLRLNPDDPSRPEYEFYQLRFDDLQGRKNPRPIRYRIEVIRDQPPDVQVLEPSTQETPVAEDGRLAIRVRAEDPDFALRSVTLRAECDGRSLPIAPLLEKPDPEKPWPGPFQATYTFEPAQWKLVAGNRVQYWVEAEDNKEPVANRSATDKRSITVIGPEGRHPSPEKSGNDQAAAGNNADQKAATGGRAEAEHNSPPPGEGQQEQQAGNPGDKGQSDQAPPPNKGPGEQQKQDQGRQPGQTAEKPDQRIDPEANPGDAFQKILQDREQQSPKQPPPKEPKSDQQQTEKANADQQPPSGEQKQSGQQQQNGDQQQSGKQPSEGGGSADEKSKGEKPGDKQTSEQQNGESGGQNSGEKKAGSQDQSGNSGSKNSGGDKQSGKSDNQDTGSKEATGQKQSGNTAGQNTGGKKAGDQKQDNETTDGKQAGSKQESGKKPGNENAANPQSDQQTSNGEQAGGEKQAADKTKKSGKENGAGEPPAGQEPGGATPGQEKPTEKPAGPIPPAASLRVARPAARNGNRLPTSNRPARKPPASNRPASSNQARNHRRNPTRTQAKVAAVPRPRATIRSVRRKPAKRGQRRATRRKTTPNRPASATTNRPPKATRPATAPAPANRAAASKASSPASADPVRTPQPMKADQRPTKRAKARPELAPGINPRPVVAPTRSIKKPRPVAMPAIKPRPVVAPKKKATPGGQSEGGTPQEHPTDGGSASRGTAEAPNAHGSANPATGGKPGAKTDSKPPEPMESPADEANLDYARRQTELALEHLRDQLDKEKPELLDRLGWTKDDARRFLEQWEGMKRAAAEKGAKGEAARKQFNDAVRSLGLRPRGTELRHGDVAPDQPENLRDAGRFPPPPDWAEQFRAYTRGVAGEERKSEKK